MNPMDRFDDEFRDSDISSLLGRVGGDAPSTNAAYRDVLDRVRRVRRRRAVAGSLGAVALIVGAGAIVVRSSTAGSERFALDPRSAVVTTPDGSTVTTPDGAPVTVIIDPATSTTVEGSDSTGVVSTPSGSNPVTTSPTAPSQPGTTAPAANTTPGGSNRPAGVDDEPTTVAPTTGAPTTTKPAPTTTRPAPTTTKPAPTTTRPAPTTTKPSVPSVPSVPANTRPSIPVSTPTTVRPVVPPSVPATPVVISRACGAGVVLVGVLNGAFVPSTLQTVVLPGFGSTVVSAKESKIEVRFTSPQGRVSATLKLRMTGNGPKDDCEVEIDRKSDAEKVDGETDSGDSSSDDNNGDRADD